MSYLSQPTSNSNYGVVKVGDYINVSDGIIFLDQNLSPNANVIFNSLNVTGNLTVAGANAVTHVTPFASNGISLSNVTTTGPNVEFTIRNTGVLSLTAGDGISVSSSNGDVIITSYGADLVHTSFTTTNYTATANDEYIGVNSVNAVNINLPAGIVGREYTIKDEHGQGSGKINILPISGELIDGASSYVISVPYASVTVVFRGGSWHLI